MSEPGYGPNPTSQGVRGYRDLDPDTVHLINEIKTLEEGAAHIWGLVERVTEADPRWLDRARDHLQDGFSALVRAVAKPYDPFRAALENNMQDEAEGAIPRRDPNAYRRYR